MHYNNPVLSGRFPAAFGKDTLTMMKKRMYTLCLLLLLVLSAGCSIKSKEQYQSELLEGDCTVSLEIRCDTILEHMDQLREEVKPLIPEDGAFLAETQVGLPEGATAYDLLEKASKTMDFVLNVTGSGSSSYVVSIGGIGEFDCGQLSGWIFFVNGERPSVGCGAYPLKEGDRVSFLYTCDLGEDLK